MNKLTYMFPFGLCVIPNSGICFFPEPTSLNTDNVDSDDSDDTKNKGKI